MNINHEAWEKDSTFSRFDRMCERYPDRTAILYLGERFSYSHLKELSERFAGSLVDMDVKKGDRVMIYISNCIQWVIAFLGIQKIGAVIVPVSPIYTSFEIEYMINDSGTETIICLDTNFCYVKEVFVWWIFFPFGKGIWGYSLTRFPTAKWIGTDGCIPSDPF
jgi:long-chain acyl-CoA synthetase